jgi:hypothetical protein
MQPTEIKSFIDTPKFFEDINNLMKQYQTNPLDAVVHYCQNKGIDLNTAAQLIRSNSKFKKQLLEDGIGLNLLEG